MLSEKEFHADVRDSRCFCCCPLQEAVCYIITETDCGSLCLRLTAVCCKPDRMLTFIIRFWRMKWYASSDFAKAFKERTTRICFQRFAELEDKESLHYLLDVCLVMHRFRIFRSSLRSWSRHYITDGYWWKPCNLLLRDAMTVAKTDAQKNRILNISVERALSKVCFLQATIWIILEHSRPLLWLSLRLLWVVKEYTGNNVKRWSINPCLSWQTKTPIIWK